MRASKFFILILSFTLITGCTLFKKSKSSEPSPQEKVANTSMLIDAVKEKNIGNYESAISKLNQLISKAPKNDVAYYQLSLIYKDNSKFNEALQYAKKAALINPQNDWYKLNLVEIYEATKQYAPAAKIREELIAKTPENSDYYFDLVVDYIYTDRWEDAINTYSRVEKINGISEDISLAKHRLWMHINKPQNAAAEIQKLMDAFPSENRYPLMLGDLYLKTGQPDKAKNMFDKSLSMNNTAAYLSLAEYYKLSKKNDSSYYYLSKAFAEADISIDLKIPVMLSYYNLLEKNPSMANDAFSLLDSLTKTHPDDPKSWSMKADFMLLKDRPKEAKTAFIEVLKYDQSKYVVWEELLKIMANEKNFDSTLLYCNKAIELFPSQPFLFYVKGLSHYMKNEYSEAATALEMGKNLVLEPNEMYLEMFIYLGESYHKLKNDDRSDAAFDKVLELDPNNAYVLNNYSYYLALRNAQLDKALTLSKRLVTSSPDQYNYQDTHAWVLFKKGDFAEAQIWIEKSLKNGGQEHAAILDHYGDILWKNGKTEKALEQWQKALLLDSTNEQLKQKVSKKSYLE
jgi:tetratricopeptide (TPR) repeat protein